MTLTQLAKRFDTTTMTIYRRLDKKGVNIKDLRDDNTKEITPAGESIIAALFDAPRETPAQQGIERNATDDVQRDAQPIEVELAVLRERLKAAEDMLTAVCGERDRLLEQVDTLTAMLRTEQQQRVRLLEDGNQRRGGLFGLFRRNRGT